MKSLKQDSNELSIKAFKTFRHFPGLAQSIQDIKKIQSNYKSENTKNEKKREIQLKSTYKLDQLTQSCISEVNAMRKVKSLLLAERAKKRDEAAAERPKITGKKMTPLQSAEVKLAKTSLKYDKRCINDDLAGFVDGPGLTLEQLDIQLKRCLNIILSPEELEALFLSMDLDNNKCIDGVEFSRYFFKLGNEYRDRIRSKKAKILEDKKILEKKKKTEDEIKQQQYEESVISEFTEKQADDAMKMLSDRAHYFDASSFIDIIFIKYFQSYLTPYEFKMQLEKSFDLILNSSELGALVKRFSTRSGKYSIDGYAFLNSFLALSRGENYKHSIYMNEKFTLKKKMSIQAKQLDLQLFPTQLGR